MICFDVSVRHPLPQVILNRERKERKIMRKDRVVQKVHHQIVMINIASLNIRGRRNDIRGVRALHHLMMKNIQNLNISKRRKNVRYRRN